MARALLNNEPSHPLHPVDDIILTTHELAEDAFEDERISPCPACSEGEGEHMGTFGWFEWFRCCSCGVTYNEHGDV